MRLNEDFIELDGINFIRDVADTGQASRSVDEAISARKGWKSLVISITVEWC